MSDKDKTIIRSQKNKNYSVIDNRALSDKRLSWKARGILAFVLTRPDDWTFYIDELIRWSDKDGEASFRAGWKELQDLGYVSRVPIREGQRIVRWETIVHESPSLLPDFLDVEKQDVGFLEVEDRALVNTDLLPKTKERNTKKPLSSDEDDTVSQVIAYLNEKTGKRFSPKTKETNKLINGRIKAGATLEEFRHVIDVKVAKWANDERMKDFLKPDTLFNEKNFEVYKQENMPSLAVTPKVGQFQSKADKDAEQREQLKREIMEGMQGEQGASWNGAAQDQGGLSVLRLER